MSLENVRPKVFRTPGYIRKTPVGSVSFRLRNAAVWRERGRGARGRGHARLAVTGSIDGQGRPALKATRRALIMSRFESAFDLGGMCTLQLPLVVFGRVRAQFFLKEWFEKKIF